MASQKINIQDMEITFGSANDLQRGTVVLLRDMFPCKVVELNKAAPGKHGAAKIKVVGIDIFSSKKYDDIFGSSDSVTLPTVKKLDYQVQFLLEDDYLKLLNLSNGEMREDLRVLDKDIASKLKQLYQEIDENEDGKYAVVTVLSAYGQERIISVSAQVIKANHAFH